jgi:hypothetical protein
MLEMILMCNFKCLRAHCCTSNLKSALSICHLEENNALNILPADCLWPLNFDCMSKAM